MINWNSNSIEKSKHLAVFLDVKLYEACINDYDCFQRFLALLEHGREIDKNFAIDIQRKIINGVKLLNWDGYFD